MSYILDALKKATSDREHRQGNIPDLRTQHVRGQPHHATAIGLGPWRKRLIAAAALLLLATSVVAIFTWRMSSVQTLERVLPSSSPAVDVVATQPTVFSVSKTNAEMPTVAVMPPPLPSAPSKSADMAPALTSNRTQRAPPASAPLIAPSAVSSATPALQLSPLPDNAPKLVVSGSTYSDNSAHRILIVNGQVFREGESPVTGIRIEKIGLKAAVLQYDGQLFLLRY